MKEVNIIEYIPYGQNNAIALKELQNIIRINSRDIRALIGKARESNVIVNLQDGKGFFQPLDGESELVKRWIAQEQSRSDKIMKATSYARYLYG